MNRLPRFFRPPQHYTGVGASVGAMAGTVCGSFSGLDEKEFVGETISNAVAGAAICGVVGFVCEVTWPLPLFLVSTVGIAHLFKKTQLFRRLTAR